MMILAKIVYWLMSILAALLLALTAVLLVDIAYGGNAGLVVARAQPGLAGHLRMVRRMGIPTFRTAHMGIDHGAIDIGVEAASVASISSSLDTGLLPSPVAWFDSGVARFDFCRLPDRRNETTGL
jgi:hypothetical protein